MTKLTLHQTQTALQTIGQYVARTFQPGSEEWQALNALWADMEARDAMGEFRIERVDYAEGEREQAQEEAILRLLRRQPTGTSISRRDVTQRMYNLAAYRFDKDNRAANVKAALDRLAAKGLIANVNDLVTLL
jgi:hypothetical protein